MKLPTDREVLKCIYEMYFPAYPGVQPGSRENDPYIAIDVHAVAAKLGCKPELLFGRLYYDLDYRHGYAQHNAKSLVHLFAAFGVGDKRHAVNFPYMAAILAGLEEQHRRNLWAVGLSIAALVISLVSLVVAWMQS